MGGWMDGLMDGKVSVVSEDSRNSGGWLRKAAVISPAPVSLARTTPAHYSRSAHRLVSSY